jgi:hypothetical protein
MIKKHILLNFLILVPVLLFCEGAAELPKPEITLVSLVQGNIYISMNGKRIPAENWQVTLYSDKSGRSAPVYTGSDGMYFFRNIAPGSYALEVWFSKLLRYDSQLNNMIKTGRITLSDPSGFTIRSSGPYSNYWGNNQFVKTERSVTISSGQSATLPEVSIPREYLESFQL